MSFEWTFMGQETYKGGHRVRFIDYHDDKPWLVPTMTEVAI
jgi:hypothetical protein